MTAPSASAGPRDDGLLDEAIAWSIRLHFNTPSAETQHAFQQWLASAPLHQRAWQQVQALRDDFAALPPQVALDTLHTADVLEKRHRLSRRRAGQLLSLAGLALGTGWLARDHTPWQRLLADASTTTGQRRTLQLPDGTTIDLNTDSAVRTRFDAGERLVQLLRGEVRITTGADAAVAAAGAATRPLRVETPFGMLQPLGTRFTVRLEDTHARVTVQQGAVRLLPSADATASTVVQAGHSGLLTPATATAAPLQAFEADGWVEGVIAGSHMRLDDLLAELARHRPGHIACDARVAALRVSGVYHLRDTDRVLQLLADTQPVRVTYLTRFWVAVGPDDTR